jgi:rod shape determining protein RodA
MRSFSLASPRPASLSEEPRPLFRRLGNIHLGPFAAALLLAGIGLVTVASATSERADGLVARQAVWVAAGVVALAVLLAVDYHHLVNMAPVLYGLGLGALVLVLFYGHEAGGARSWFLLGPFSVQPSELHKIATVLLLTRYLSRLSQPHLNLKDILVAGLIGGAPVVLLALEPDMGTAGMFMPMLIAMVLVAGLKPRHVVAAALLALIGAAGVWTFAMKDYQRQRIRTFLSPEADPQGSGYQVRQSKIAVGSGQWTGRGWGQGTQSQLRFLPERHSDFVMAVLAEEWGFLGVATVLGLYALVLSSTAKIALRSRDRAGILLAVGLVSIVASHVVYNTGMVVGLLPITGIPLPFISYGGSFMLFNFLAVGLILNVDYRRYVNR